MTTEPLAKSYVRHKGQWYLISTIDRDSSAMYGGPMRYAETMVWLYDYETKEFGELLWEGEGMVGTTRTHFQVAESYAATGNHPPCSQE